MFTKTMKFDDLEGNEVTQKFYFNYNKKEIGELLNFGHLEQFPPKAGEQREGLEEMIAKLKTSTDESGLSEVENTRQAYGILHNLLLDAYGEKGSDNVTFVKDDRTRGYFRSHVAFVELIFELIASPNEIAEFLEKCLPAKEVEEAKREMASQGVAKGNLMEMSLEAERRQANPDTRIEPGPVAPPVPTNQEGPTPVAPVSTSFDPASKVKSEWTPADIWAMSDEDFASLAVKGLNNEAIQAAFERKTR